MMNKSNLNILICLFLIVGCREKEPIKNQITGVWVSADSAVLEFKENGTFSGKSLPAKYFTVWSWKDEKEVLQKKVDGNGKWNIVKGQGGWEIQLDFKKRSSEKLFGKIEVLLSKQDLFKMGDTWIIWIWEGDESDRCIFYKN